MSNGLIFIANSKSVFRAFILLHFIVLLGFIAYKLIRIALDPQFKLNYSLFFIPFIVFVWNLFTEKNVTEVKFDHHSNELLIVEKTMIGKRKSYTLNYEELNFSINNISNFLRRKIAGSKVITFHKDDKALYVSKSSGFNEDQLSAIETNLIKIKNDFNRIVC